MKNIKYLLIAVTVTIVCWAANHRSQNLVGNGGKAILFYQATGAAQTFQFDDAYTTNVLVTNAFNTVVTPQATNTATGSLVPSWSAVSQAYGNQEGDVASPNISVTLLGNATLTNAVTFVFVRSGNGTDFGYSLQDQFSFQVTPTTALATIITNVPAMFLTGTKTIMPYQIKLGVATTAGLLTLSNMTFNGYIP